LAAWLINRALGNTPDSTVLEIAYPPASALVQDSGWFCFGGADCDIEVQFQGSVRSVPVYAPCWLPAGSRLYLGNPRVGCLSYVAVRGGFQAPKVLGSTACDTHSGIGKALKKGDSLMASMPGLDVPVQGRLSEPGILIARSYPAGFFLTSLYQSVVENGAAPASKEAGSTSAEPVFNRKALHGSILQVLPGLDYAALSAVACARLCDSNYRVSRQSNRMGLRLLGDPIIIKDQPERFSTGVCMGAVQLPPDGLPIILNVEHQPTGGYCNPLVVCSHHHSQLAQLRPGDTVRFRLITHAQARQAQRRLQQRLAGLNLPALPFAASASRGKLGYDQGENDPRQNS
jgi:antagonist of KipI